MGRSGGKAAKMKANGGSTRSSFRGKASPELVEEIRSRIAQIDSQELRERYRKGEISNNFEGQDMDKRYRYDLFWAAASDIYSKVNKEGLKSDHLDTVLKEVVPPLNEDVELESGPDSLNGNDPVGEIKIRPNVNPFDPNQNLQYDEKGAYTTTGNRVIGDSIKVEDKAPDTTDSSLDAQAVQAGGKGKHDFVADKTDSLNQFLEGNSRAKQAAKALNKLTRYDGKVYKKHQLIEKLINDDDQTVKEIGSKTVITTGEDTFLHEDDLTKAEIDYAKHLVANKKGSANKVSPPAPSQESNSLSEEEDRLETIRAKERQKIREGLKDRKYAREAKKNKKVKVKADDDLVAAVESDIENLEEQDRLLEEFDL